MISCIGSSAKLEAITSATALIVDLSILFINTSSTIFLVVHLITYWVIGPLFYQIAGYADALQEMELFEMWRDLESIPVALLVFFGQIFRGAIVAMLLAPFLRQNAPYNKLDKLPPSKENVETIEILRKINRSTAALAELKGIVQTIPNQEILINAIVLQEAKDSSEIENFITTQDELYKALTLNKSNQYHRKVERMDHVHA